MDVGRTTATSDTQSVRSRRAHSLQDHLNDPNYDVIGTDYDESIGMRSFDLSRGGYDGEKQSTSGMETEPEFEDDLEDDSPYPEVRAAVANTDDPSIPTNTLRMWALGLFFTVIISGLNQFFSLRYPSVFITALLAQLLALPAGKAWERVMPSHVFSTFGYEWSLNPGPFNIKEHCLITVMANVVAGGAYATDIIGAQRMLYDQDWGLTYQLLLVISSQMIGFSVAGVCRQFLVWPASMIWPATLVNTALFNTLHSSYGQPGDGRMSRERFFSLALLASFLWYFFPGYLFTALSVFNWVCWIAPRNPVVNSLFGISHGLGMSVLTFDWAMISYIGSPLVTPWWAEANVFASIVIVFWIICPILYFNNAFFSQYMPISSSQTYDNTGRRYEAARVLENGEFSLEKYHAYSPLYISLTFVLSYGLSFGALTATLVHTILWYRKDIIRQLRSSLQDETDVHARLMQAYPEVPHWWYAIIGVVSFALGIVTIQVWDTKLQIWAYIVSLVIALVYLLPVGMLQAITNQQVGLNVITELIVGYILPGKPVAMMIFKTFGYITMAQALAFVSDLKLGHYMKIPPRLMFLAQTIATLLSCFVVVAVQNWMFNNIPLICTKDQPDKFTCPGINTFGTASLIWGGIGPQRTFSDGGIYSPMLYFFLIGAILPIPFWWAARRWPKSWFRYVNWPIFMTGTGNLPPALAINYSSWALVGFIFQYLVRRRHFKWWSRYNYILSAALDGGVAIGAIVIFFALEYPKRLPLPWWGNQVYIDTDDYQSKGFFDLEDGEIFGPPALYRATKTVI